MRCSYSPFLSKAVVVSNNVLPVLQAADNTKNSANALGELRPSDHSTRTQRTLQDSIYDQILTGATASVPARLLLGVGSIYSLTTTATLSDGTTETQTTSAL